MRYTVIILLGRIGVSPFWSIASMFWDVVNASPAITLFFSFFHVLFLFESKALAHGESFKEQQPSDSLLMGDMFCRGISLFASAQNNHKRWPAKRYGRKILCTFQSWFKQGNPNVKHYEMILTAESARLNNKKSLDAVVVSLYRKGIVCAARNGFVQDAAIASERLADYIMTVKRDDKDAAILQYKEAERFYAAWGAERKVRMIREKYSDMPEQVTTVRFSEEMSTLSVTGASSLLVAAEDQVKYTTSGQQSPLTSLLTQSSPVPTPPTCPHSTHHDNV
jgi:hypothetical protein